MSVSLFRSINNNPRNHPLSLGLLYAYCPAAAYWWRVGVEIRPPFNAVWQAVEDYSARPPRTLRQYLEDYGLESLLDDARRYIEQVKAARQRLPYVKSPELLPTFPGGKLPLRKRFGIRDELEAIGGAEGFFAYVRAWAFLIPDWLAAMPYKHVYPEAIWVAVHFDGLRSAYRLPTWAFFTEDGRHSPLVLGVPPDAFPALASLYLLAQAEGKHAWMHTPQVWQLALDGSATPVDPIPSADDIAHALLAMGEYAGRAENPLPLASLVNPAKCRECVFRGMCFNEKSRAWTPQASVFAKKGRVAA